MVLRHKKADERINVVKWTVAGVLVLIMLYAGSWLFTCGIIKLITMCLGLKFDWLIATVIWLVLYLLKK